MSSIDPGKEAERILAICGACMYCDGLCPVFPTLSGKPLLTTAYLNYLANLCHNCRACWYACQYAPPHPFAVNVPATLAGLRRQSYTDYVWPRGLSHAFRRPEFGAALVAVAALAAMLVLVAANGSLGALWVARMGPGSFYAVAPWAAMAALAAAACLWVIVSVAASTYRFWRAVSGEVKGRMTWLGCGLAMRDIVTLRHLGGTGPGCNDSDARFSRRRRALHHVMAGGLVLDFAATLAAAVYQDVFGVAPPYPLLSLPVCAGVIGGLAAAAGAGGLLGLEARSDREPSERGEVALNVIFLIALEIVAISGLAVLAFRDTAAMGALLVCHLGVVLGLFAALPATKLLHAPFRAAALLRAVTQQKPPRPLRRARSEAGAAD